MKNERNTYCEHHYHQCMGVLVTAEVVLFVMAILIIAAVLRRL